jgi:hypothetical protein
MFPPPRPPSPTSRARAQQLRLASSNPNTLTPKDAEILMSMQKPNQPVALPRSGRRASRGPSMMSKSTHGGVEAGSTSPISPKPPSSGPSSPKTERRSSTPILPPTAIVSSPPSPEARLHSSGSGKDAALLQWVNAHSSASMSPAKDFSSSFRSGQRLLRLAEHLSGRSKGIADARFAKLVPDSDEELDIGFDVFDFFIMDLGIDTGDVSVGEMLRGDRSQVIKLVEALRAKFGA